MVFGNQFFQYRFGFVHAVLRGSRIDYGSIKYFSGRIHHGEFASGTECRVPAKYNLTGDWRLHQKLF